MKIRASQILFFGIALSVTSCSVHEQDLPAGKDACEYVFTASLGDGSKATVSDSGKGEWSAGDQIAVYDAISGQFCTFTSASGDGVFVFEGQPGVGYEFTKACYPASVALTAGSVSLPAEYTTAQAKEGTVFPMTAVPEEGHLSFRHLGALLKIVLRHVPATADALLISSSGTSLSGEFAIEASGSAELISAQAGQGTVMVNLEKGASEQIVKIPLPVGTYSVTLTLKNGQETLMEYTTATSREISRAKLVFLRPITVDFLDGSGTLQDPFIVGSASDLVALSEAASLPDDNFFRSACYTQVADIDMAAVDNFPPIGSVDYPFAGSYDGGGFTISNLVVNHEGNSAGLFGYIRDGAVRNVSLVKATVSSSANYAAGVAGVLYSGDIVRCRLDAESVITATVRGAGSIAGLMRSGVVDACASHAGVYAGQDIAGGIVGYMYPNADSHDAVIINCSFDPVYKDGAVYLNSATVQSGAENAFLGGIAGSVRAEKGHASLVNCYAYPLRLRTTRAAGEALKYVGGIAGRIVEGNVIVYNCITPITYSNVLFGDTRLDAKAYASYSNAACIIGCISQDGASVNRVFSKNTWPVSFNAASGVSVSTSDITLKMGDTNMRGYGDCVFSNSYAISGTKTYTQAAGGVLAALNEGVALWNARSSEITALEWAFDPTFGYPKPAGVDVPGVVTRKVSLLGDSISTYQGYIFSTDDIQMNKFYPDTGNSYSGMVLNEQDTWWWKIIYGKMTGARLDAANAFGGSTVSYLESKVDGMAKDPNDRMMENSIQKRYLDYGVGAPDILFYHGGRNDFGQFGGNTNVLLGSYDTASLEAAYSAAPGQLFGNYCAGTVAVLRDFHSRFPEARILIIVHDMMSDGYEMAARAITAFLIGKGIEVRYVSLHEEGTNNKTNATLGITKENGTHPNSEGCTNMANYIFEKVGVWLNGGNLPWEGQTGDGETDMYGNIEDVTPDDDSNYWE